MIKSKPLRVTLRLLLFFLWLACIASALNIVPDKDRCLIITLVLTLAAMVADDKLAGKKLSPPPDEGPEGKFWLQHADGPCDIIADETAAGLAAAVKAFDWEGELEKYKKLGKRKGVPPGLGLGNYGDPHFVHITASSVTECDVLYVRGDQKAKDQVYKEGLPFNATSKIIAAFLAVDEKKLLELLD